MGGNNKFGNRLGSQRQGEGFMLGMIADKVAKSNPLYNELGRGDRKAEVTRLYERVHIVKYRKSFYFSMSDDSAELILAK